MEPRKPCEADRQQTGSLLGAEPVSQLQLSELEKQNEAVMLEFWATEKHIGKLGDEIEQRRKHSENLEAQTQALYMENVNLQLSIEQEEEHFQLLLAGYNTYRNKIDAHKEVIAYVEGKTATTSELLEKREIVKKLREKKELRIDLENPEGNISEVKDTVNKKIACLVKEQEVHIQLKKEVEMQNRRCEAILKRLHCQLNKTQSNKRQWNWDIQQIERKVAELRKCLGITE
ncbi:hypothetical protein AOXY_G9051 [Acipenser oxyrinchus oxyrinchus]|uniref:Coiled-coil domain-containing protein 122 n=1 Tax=Acipenser oxyrinchus oxyrinchus TaxID=40147 RepID=A0AAD8LM50_ACIOX|nr:hypothetical protein AOXY_G9051 [Acipenser oxyrinchus oxyrinchus]